MNKTFQKISKNFLFYMTHQMMNSIGKTEKMHGQKLLNPSESRMVGPVYNKAANGICSKDVSRTTNISEMEFFVIIVNRSALRIFTNIVKFSS